MHAFVLWISMLGHRVGHAFAPDTSSEEVIREQEQMRFVCKKVSGKGKECHIEGVNR